MDEDNNPIGAGPIKPESCDVCGITEGTIPHGINSLKIPATLIQHPLNEKWFCNQCAPYVDNTEILEQLIQDLQGLKDMIGPTCEAGHFKTDPVMKHFVEDCDKLGIYNITLQKRDSGLSITVNLCEDCFKVCQAIHQALNGGA